MKWNWQLADWPNFSFDVESMAPKEAEFMRLAGVILGKCSHLKTEDREQLRLETISEEAVQTSRIEGEILDRASVQSSLRQHFGLKPGPPAKVGFKEKGIANVLTSAWETSCLELTNESLCKWHRQLMNGQLPEQDLGEYRSDQEPMRIISGDPLDPEVHFEAPPSSQVPSEMNRFLEWFRHSRPKSKRNFTPTLTRSAIAHLHFETIHPFADGNGRIGRVIAEKAIFQGVGQPMLLAMSQVIERQRKSYYEALATTRFTNEIGAWTTWFADMAITSATEAIHRIDFLVFKTRFFDQYRNQLNERQEKVLRRIFAEGPKGFNGGLSAGNYVSLTKTSSATARRDLAELVKLGALVRTGDRKATRYHLEIVES